jgi:cellulose synthase/poly-beta-1,6-N-acetylglucosamine synthase-like glycosyltransferase
LHPVEVIVVDVGSTDGTADLVESLRLPGVRVIRQENAGKPAALNTALAAASWDLVVMVDGDTVFEPGTVRTLVQPFTDPRVGAVSGNAKVVNRGGLLGRWQHIEYVIGGLGRVTSLRHAVLVPAEERARLEPFVDRLPAGSGGRPTAPRPARGPARRCRRRSPSSRR